MAASVVSFAVERLGSLLIEEAKFLHGVEGQVMDLRTELIRMQCFLEDADAVQDKNKRVRNWVAEIRELAYEAETVLDTFISGVESKRRIGGFRRFTRFFNEGKALHKVGSQIDSIKNKIADFSTRLQIYGIRDLSRDQRGSSSSAHEKLQMLRRTYSHVIEEDFIDFRNFAAKLVRDLVDEEKEFRVTSICGIGGLGKTTFAKQVYHHDTIRRHFDGFAWVCVSQQLKKDDILLGILIGLMPEEKRNDVRTVLHENLVKQIFQILEKKKCLVVLDDIWSTEDWDAIRAAFPTGKNGSKILLTSRNKDVAIYVDPSHIPSEPQLLNDEESWELFGKKAFIGGVHPGSITIEEQNELGRSMLRSCGGLPLAIVVLGGILVTKNTLEEWKAVHKNIDSYLKGDNKGLGEQGKTVTEILVLSYHDLPYWLKPCFLHLGSYPKDGMIWTHTLYQLWIAEGFISPEKEQRGKEETLMEVAGCYLAELARRSMVEVQIFKHEEYGKNSGGRFLTCGLHDLMRDMCLSMAKEENFVKVIDRGQSNEQQFRSSSSSFLATSSSSSSIRPLHRLAVHGNENIDLSDLCIDQGKNIRSALFLNGMKFTHSFRKTIVSRLPKDFKLVRALHIDEFRSNGKESVELPKAAGDLIHLRYLSLRMTNYKLPPSIGNLRYLLTLDLFTIGDGIIPNVLWKLKQLRHLYLPFRWEPVKYPKLRLDGLDNLELLENFFSKSCNLEDLEKLTNLRRLTQVEIVENEQHLGAFVRYLRISITQKELPLRYCSVSIDKIDFCTEEALIRLKQIFFECHLLHELDIHGGRILKLPEYQQGFHSSLTRLLLSGSQLMEQDPLAVLEKLPNLVRLQLQVDAFLGKEMVCSVQGFPRLKILGLTGLPNLEDWRVDEGAMPNLFSLTISACNKLKMVPDGLRYISTLQKLSIDRMPQAFVNRLRLQDGTRGVDFDKVRHIPSIQFEENLVDTVLFFLQLRL